MLPNYVRIRILFKWKCATNVELYFFKETLSGSPQKPVIFTMYNTICIKSQTFVIVWRSLQHHISWLSFWTLQWTICQNLIPCCILLLEWKNLKLHYQQLMKWGIGHSHLAEIIHLQLYPPVDAIMMDSAASSITCIVNQKSYRKLLNSL